MMSTAAGRMVLGLALLVGGAGAALAGQWPEETYNPQPASGDLVLPMPCGGAMTFRPVVVPSKDLMDDRRIVVGALEPELGFKENQRANYVAGGFSAPRTPGERVYYVGKYEVTALQHSSLGSECPVPGDEARTPKTKVSWAEAVAFADAYSAWLIEHAKDKLPSEDGQPGFLRLPTEDEWDYAARGGAKVAEADFSAALFPMDGPLATYVQYSGPDSSNNELQWIGLLKPNPLGLHDMLGNAGELVFDLFRLSRMTRPHGQAGGFVVRGGDYMTPQDSVRTSARDEFPPYDGDGVRRPATVGYRLALVPPVLPTPARVRAVQAAWKKLPADGGGAPAAPVAVSADLPTPTGQDPVKDLDDLAGAVRDAALQQRLRELRNSVAGSIATRNEQRDRAARATLNLATYLASNLRFDTQKILALEEVAALGSAQAKERLPKDVEALRSTTDYYRNTLRLLLDDYTDGVRDDQLRVLQQELGQRSASNQLAAVSLVRENLTRLKRDGDIPPGDLETALRRELCRNGAKTNYPTACTPYQ